MKNETIKLEVNGEQWQRVSKFKHSTSEDKHYVLKIDEDGSASIRFGDGKHGRRPPTGASINVNYSRYSGVSQQQGRVQLDDGNNEDMVYLGLLCGIYRGVVIDNNDPESLRRILVKIPAVLGSRDVWSLPCTPLGASELPAIDQGVWIMFEGGDPRKPVWMGTWTNPE